VEVALSRGGRRVVAAQGTPGLRVEQDRTKHLPTVPDNHAAPLDLRLAFGPFDQRALPEGWNADPPVSATVGGTGSLRGSLEQPVVGVEVSVAGARWAPLPWTDPLEGAITATLQRSGVDLRRASFVRRGQPFVEIAGRVDLDPRAATPRVTGMQGSARVHEVDLASFTPIQGRPVTGRASATLSFSGTPDDPDAVARVSIARLGIAGIDYRPSEISARVADGMLEVDAQLRQVFGGTLRAEANLPLSHQRGVALLPDEGSALRGELAASSFRIDGLEAFLPEVAMMGGTTDASLALSGTRGRPGLRGSIAVRDGSFELSVLGQRYEEISLTAVVEPNRLVLTELSTRDRAGSATVTGTATLDGLFPERFELSARGRSFPIVRDGVTLAEVSGRVEVRGRASRTGLEATIEPQGLRVALPRRAARDLQVLEDHPDIDIRRRFEDPPGAARPGTGGRRRRGSIPDRRGDRHGLERLDLAQRPVARRRGAPDRALPVAGPARSAGLRAAPPRLHHAVRQQLHDPAR
jgi:autotransporter translocation and assembly factor TamB